MGTAHSVSALCDRVFVWNWVSIYCSKDTANKEFPSQRALSCHLHTLPAVENTAPASTSVWALCNWPIHYVWMTGGLNLKPVSLVIPVCWDPHVI